jgi:3-demethoxyubiquinol 3-hydroxylase
MAMPDRLIQTLDAPLRTLAAPARAQRDWKRLQSVSADDSSLEVPLTETERQHAAGLRRVNHVGEVCAQALYTTQAFGTRDAALAAHFREASAEETDHLTWTEQRLRELGSRTSLLNPLWYAGAFAISTVTARLGDRWSLGFVVETERQVEAHLDQLPAQDHALARHRAANEDGRSGSCGCRTGPWRCRVALPGSGLDAGGSEGDDDAGVPGVSGGDAP